MLYRNLDDALERRPRNPHMKLFEIELRDCETPSYIRWFWGYNFQTKSALKNSILSNADGDVEVIRVNEEILYDDGERWNEPLNEDD